MTRAVTRGDWRPAALTSERVDTGGLRELADVLSGPYAITVRGWLLLAPLSVAVIGIAAVHGGDSAIPMVASAIAAQLAMLALLLAVRVGLDRTGTGQVARRLVVLAAFAGCGVIRTGASLAVTGETGPEAAALAVNALQTGVLVAVVALTLTALVVSQWERYAGRSRALATELARLDVLRSAAERGLADVDRTIEETVAAPLRQTLAAAEADLGTDAAPPGNDATMRPEHLAELALDLRRMAAGVVRPLSHDLAASTSDTPPSVLPLAPSPISRASTFVGATFSVAPFQPALTVLVVAPLVAVIALQELHDPWVTVGTVLDIVIGILGAVAARRWLTAPIRSRPMAFRVTAVAGVWLLQAGLWVLVGWPILHDIRAWPSFVAGSLSLPILSLFAAAGAAFADGRRAVEARLAAANAQVAAETAQLRREAAERRLGLAQLLHGHVIGTLTAAAVLVAAAAEDPDATAVDEAKAAVAEARAALDDLTRHPALVTDLAVVLGEHRGLWQGLLELDVEVDPALGAASHDAALLGALDRLVGECLSSAVRHGHARHAAVRVTTAPASSTGAGSRPPPGVLLTVDSDGTPAEAQTWPSVAPAMFHQLAVGWSRESLPDGSNRIRLELAPARRHDTGDSS